MTNINNRYKCKIIITDNTTGEEVVYNLDKFNSNLANDLYTVPTYAGDFLSAPMYSKGFHVEVNGYMKNPNANNEYKDACNEAAQRLATRWSNNNNE